MTCPRCNVVLTMSDRQGVEIDYCPQCRGVWLDRGELDKIIERETSFAPRPTEAPTAGASAPWRRDDDDDRRYDRYDDDDDRFPNRRGRRKRGWLGELFDFD